MVYKESILEKGIQLMLLTALFLFIVGNFVWFYVSQYLGYIIALGLLMVMITTIFIGLFAFTVWAAYKVLIQKKKHNQSIY